MFWINLILVACIGLIGINLIRKYLKQYFPKLNNTILDKILFILVISVIIITAVKYYIDQKEIQTLQAEIDISKYQEVACYNAFGNKSGSVEGVRMIRTPIDDWNKKFVYRHEGEIVSNCNEDFFSPCQSVIHKMPLYPFSYYFMAKCLKEKYDPSWREYAMKAKKILEKTTQIPNHKSDHDKALNNINSMFQ